MLDTLKRWISGASTDGEWGGLAAWAKQKDCDFKRVRDDGFVIDGILAGASGQPGWHLQWGRSQRDYIAGRELQMRIELQMTDDLQMMALSRPLMEQLEKAAYEQFTNTSQTFIDGSAPEEMRWLSMFSKVSIANKSLRERIAVVASEPNLAASWIDGPLSEQFVLATREWLLPESVLVLMTLRGRLHLRLACDKPDPALIESVLSVFLAAARNADRVAKAAGPTSTNEWPSTAISTWQAQMDAADSRLEGDTH